jgi:hypothetical protein
MSSTAAPAASRARAGLLALVVSVPVAYACASGGGARRTSDEAPHDVNVEVQNDLPMPSVVTAYVVEGLGLRRYLGEVAGGETRTFTFRPTSYGQDYRLVAYRQLERPISSVPFIISSAVTGTVVWSIFNGTVQFFDQDVTDTTLVNANKGPIRVGTGDSARAGDTTGAVHDTGSAGDTTRDTTRRTP